MGAGVGSSGTASSHFHFPGFPVDAPLVVLADGAMENNPVAFPVAEALVLFLVEDIE